jgi:hypothetical protein
MTRAQLWDRRAVHDELDRVQADFRRLLGQATPAGLARSDHGQDLVAAALALVFS